MKTIFVKPREVVRKWYLIDADGKVLGKVAAKAAELIRGKHKPLFTPHQEVGDYVIVINAAKVVVTGRKSHQKEYIRHSGYPGGLTSESFEKVIKRKPVFPVEHAIRGMLPKGRLGRKLYTNAKVYADGRHPHGAQQPEKIEI
ncbi:MAG: 50S ribosomal protein L13 [Spirochaetales bacterium]|nr:50S ribosomal protein L13 [Spirochaetales bacterium]